MADLAITFDERLEVAGVKNCEELYDYKQTPYIQFGLSKINSITGQTINSTEELEVVKNGITFQIKSGATQVKIGLKKARVKELPLVLWQSEVEKRLSSGWTVITTEHLEEKEIKYSGTYKQIEQKSVQQLLDKLIAANNEMISKSYSKKITQIPQRNIDYAQSLLIDAAKEKNSLSVKEFNHLINDVILYVPRPVADIRKLLATDRSQFSDIIQREQDKLDTLQQYLRTSEITSTEKTVLEAYGLAMREVTQDEEKRIKEMMSSVSNRYIRAFRCVNEKTEAAFNEYCKAQNLSDGNGITELFHGSGVENWWSIFKNGLYLNPQLIKSDVVICGKAFGYGIYFAPFAGKSMGYAGGYWRAEGSEKHYLAIYKVATGNPYYIYSDPQKKRPNHWGDFHADHPNMHCCWAEMGKDASEIGLNRLRSDEVIVYQEQQCTIEFLIEFE